MKMTLNYDREAYLLALANLNDGQGIKCLAACTNYCQSAKCVLSGLCHTVEPSMKKGFVLNTLWVPPPNPTLDPNEERC